jgi:pimeloyl-ACP methyl ester carboxylesterase
MLIRTSTSHLRRILGISSALALVAVVWISVGVDAAPRVQSTRPTIVLVHGDWADASSWNPVIARLRDRGFTVVAPPNTLRGPTQDAQNLASYLRTIRGPFVLVAHSYGGFVVTNAATGMLNVKALVYIDAFAPDVGQTTTALLAPSGSCILSLNAFNTVPFIGGLDLYLRWEANPPYTGFRECFANGVDEETAAVLIAGQRPSAAVQLVEPSSLPAWRLVPSWALLGTLDNVIPPALQQSMYERAGARVTRVEAGHLSLITHPDAVVGVILSAVDATT